MKTTIQRRESRIRRHRRVRKAITGFENKPRLCVYRSLQHIYAQIINDDEGKTLVSASTMDKELRDMLKVKSNKAAAAAVGELIAKRAVKENITQVVFDRGGYRYHGRIAALADGARKAGLKF